MKRAIDFAFSLLMIVIASPIILLTSCLVRTKLGSPVLFKQLRPGLNGKPFYIYKFRTMTQTRDAEGNLLPDALRLTSFGRLLRNLSLDELPQLINVLRGELSLVGPRPLLMQYLDRYTERQARRHLVKPGITGWAQVNGRNAITWEQKFELDVWYVDNQSLLLDLKILCLTVKRVLERKGVNQAGEATMQEFMGGKVERR
ncbi:sugar transferase [Geoanaerobacter pelophilus]|uniref:sugar transferase n=1 Tax=Geoanaerobacter pelophilus TaxID=60036 RepID=UPI000A267A80|nr:sugar transferase [Geoanaerobacter pelophilus]